MTLTRHPALHSNDAISIRVGTNVFYHLVDPNAWPTPDHEISVVGVKHNTLDSFHWDNNTLLDRG